MSFRVRDPRRLLVLVACVLLVASVVLLVVRALSGGREEETQANEPPACGKLDTSGGPVPDVVEAVHSAACRRDGATIAALLGTLDEDAHRAAEAELRHPASARMFFLVLADTLERPPIVDQGGRTYCQQNGGVAVFSRGTAGTPPAWSSFTVDRSGLTAPVPEGC